MPVSLKTAVSEQQQKEPVLTQQDIDTFSRLTVRDFKILRRFYFTKQPFPNDVALYTVGILHQELKGMNIKYTSQGLRKRLDLFVSLGLLTKLKSFMSYYNPIRETDQLKEKLKYFFETFF